MQARRYKLFLFLFIFLIGLLACKTVSNNSTETSLGLNSNAIPNNNGSEPDTSLNSNLPSDPEYLDLENTNFEITDLNFYSDFFYSFSGEDALANPIYGSMHVYGKTVLLPEKSTDYEIDFEGSAVEEGRSYIHFVSIGEHEYVYFPETGCLSFSPDDINTQTDLFSDPSNMLLGSALKVENNVKVNGIMTDKHQLSEENLDFNNVDFGETLTLEKGFIWVAKEGYLVKLELEGTGTSTTLAGMPNLVGKIKYEFDFNPISEPILISPPEECALTESEDLVNPFPITDDASNISSIGEQFLSYYTSFSKNELLNFFNNEMISKGFNLDSEIVVDTLITLRFIKGDDVIDILAVIDETGVFYVTIAREN